MSARRAARRSAPTTTSAPNGHARHGRPRLYRGGADGPPPPVAMAPPPRARWHRRAMPGRHDPKPPRRRARGRSDARQHGRREVPQPPPRRAAPDGRWGEPHVPTMPTTPDDQGIDASSSDGRRRSAARRPSLRPDAEDEPDDHGHRRLEVSQAMAPPAAASATPALRRRPRAATCAPRAEVAQANSHPSPPSTSRRRRTFEA